MDVVTDLTTTARRPTWTGPSRRPTRPRGGRGRRCASSPTSPSSRQVVGLFADIWGRTRNPPMTLELLRAFTKAGNYVGGAFDGRPAGRRLRRLLPRPGRGRAAQPHRRRRAGGVPAATSASRSSCTSARGRCCAASPRSRGPSTRWSPQRLLQPGQARRPGRSSTCRTSTAPMNDAINGDDDSDRLLVRWRLRDPAVVAACAGSQRRPRSPTSSPPARWSRSASAPTAARCPAGSDGATCAGRRTAGHRGAARRRPGAGPAAGALAVREALSALVADGGRIDGLRPDRLVRRAGGDRVKLDRSRAAPDRDAAGLAVPHVVRHRRPRATSCCVRVVTDEAEGWGECVAMADPLYSSEYVDGAADVLRRFLLPGARRGRAARRRTRVATVLEPFKGHRMAKAALEMARARRRAARARAGRSAASSARSTTGCRAASRSGIMDSIPAAARRRRRLPRRGLRPDQAQDRAGLGRRAGARGARAVRRRRAAAGRRQHGVHAGRRAATSRGSTRSTCC